MSTQLAQLPPVSKSCRSGRFKPSAPRAASSRWVETETAGMSTADRPRRTLADLLAAAAAAAAGRAAGDGHLTRKQTGEPAAGAVEHLVAVEQERLRGRLQRPRLRGDGKDVARLLRERDHGGVLGPRGVGEPLHRVA